MTGTFITTIPPPGHPGRSVQIKWERSTLGPDLWTGTLQAWDDPRTKRGPTRVVDLGQTAPLGGIRVSFDQVDGGAWAFAQWHGTGISERDLQWATAWAALALDSWERQENHHG